MESELKLVAGLGNPGRKYANTRHNIGFWVADRLSKKFSIPLDRKKFKALFGIGYINGQKLLIAKPGEYMNNSGRPLFSLAHFFGIAAGQMIVVHDDIDLAWGQIKIKTEGVHGGHNGLRSIMETFGTGAFKRVRVGIGHPGDPDKVIDYVLGKFSKAETARLGQIVDMASEAAATVLQKGEKEAMAQFHGTRPEGIL